MSGLSATQEEIQTLQKEFIRLDLDKDGKIGVKDLVQMVDTKVAAMYNTNWDKLVKEIGEGGDGKTIDF